MSIVDPPKGPVLLNYGLNKCRFVKPVYPGTTIQVRFTVKEKVDQEKPVSLDPGQAREWRRGMSAPGNDPG